MTDQVTNETETPEGNQANDSFTLEDVEKRYFPPSDLASAQALLTKINQLKASGTRVDTTYDPEKPFPANYGLGVIPLSERSQSGEGNIKVGVVLAAIPDPDLVAQDEAGQKFIRENTINSFLTKVANASRVRQDGSTATPPFTVKDFVEGGRRGESLKTFTELAPGFVKALRSKGLKFITSTILRQCLANTAFAENQFPGVAQENWLHVIGLMVDKAVEKGLDPAVLHNWVNTRDQQNIDELDDVDFGDLEI